MSKRIGILIVLGLLGALALLAACRAPSERVATPTPETGIALPTATPLGAEVKPVPGGVLRGYYTTDPPYWDPNGGTTGAHSVLNRIGGPLLQFNFGPKYPVWNFDLSSDGLARSWDISADGLTYTIHLRQGLLWQNKPPLNGRELVATDVKWTYDRHMTQLGAPRREQLQVIDSIECPDKYTVVIRLKERRAEFLLTLAGPYIEILAPELATITGDLETPKAAIGWGPFQLEEFLPNVRTVYKKNPTYYRASEGLPYLDGEYYLLIGDASTSLAAFRAEQIDIRTVERIDLASLKQSNPNIYCYENEVTAGCYGLCFQTSKPPFNDARLRQAASMAINRKEWIDAFYYGYGKEQTGPIHVESPWHAGDLGECAKYEQYNPEEARKLVAEAGYPDGLSVTLTTWGSGTATYLEYTEYIADALTRVGLKTTLEPKETGAYTVLVRINKAYDNMTFPSAIWGGATYGPDTWLNQIHATGAGSNLSKVSDPKLDEMMKAQSEEMDPKKRQDLLNEIQKYITCQMYYVYFPHNYAVTCVQPWVRDYQTHAVSTHTGRIAELIWFTEDSPRRKG